jgi:hypothetical protein
LKKLSTGDLGATGRSAIWRGKGSEADLIKKWDVEHEESVLATWRQ